MSSSENVKQGDTVEVHYTGSFVDSGEEFDSSKNRGEPLKFVVGKDNLIQGFTNAVVGMHVGEEKTVILSPNEAYGEHKKDLIRSVSKKFFPENINLVVGTQLQIGEGEEIAIVTIKEVGEEDVVLDANHPFAGRELKFDIELLSIV